MTKDTQTSVEEKLEIIIVQQATIIEQQAEIIEKLEQYGVDLGRSSYTDPYDE